MPQPRKSHSSARKASAGKPKPRKPAARDPAPPPKVHATAEPEPSEDALRAALAMIRDLLARGIVITAGKRTPLLPDLPTSGEAGMPGRVEAYFQPGTMASSMVIAADLKATSYVSGHWTEFPGNEPTVLMQTPFVGNQMPDHTVLHDGPCE